MGNELDDTAQAETQEQVVDPSTTETTEDTSTPKEEIMIPKSRFDEAVAKARNTKPDVKQNVNIEEVIRREIAPLKVKLETQEVLTAHPDFKDYASGALKLIQTNPSLSLEDAYKLTKYDVLQSKAKEEGKNEAYQTIDKKENLQFEKSGPNKPARSAADLISDKTVPLDEIKKMLPHS